MKKHCLCKSIFSGLILITLALVNTLQSQTIKPTKVIQNVKHDISLPLRDIRTFDLPGAIVSSEIAPPKKSKRLSANDHSVYKAEDAVIQDQIMNMRSAENPVVELEYSGINYVDLITKFEPPDTQGDVGPNHYFQVVNSEFAIWDKEGNKLLGNMPNQTIWEGFDDGLPFDGIDGIDPVVIYDEYADRWLFGTLITNPTGYNGSYILIAVSTTPDPTFTWNRYAYAYNGETEDYEKFGVWHDGYYMTANEQTFDEGAITIFDRDAMINGDTDASAIYFQLGNDYYGLLPADSDGPLAPPDTIPHVSLALSAIHLNTLDVFTTVPDWDTPSNSTVTLDTLHVASFVGSVYGQINQPGTSQIIFALADRLMYRLQYRNFGTHHTLVANHSVRNTSTSMYGIRWYELRDEGSGFQVYQQGTFLPADNTHRWMGSIAMNGFGDISLGYSVSNTTDIYPSIRFTGQTHGAPLGLGVMDIPETSIIEGAASQTSSGRWGDYSMMTVDPSDDYTFWYTQEYTSGGNQWLTRIAKINPGTLTLPEPMAHWPMNEGDGFTTQDASINNNDGTLQYGAEWVEGILGYAIGFDGINDRVNCGPGPEMNIGDGDFSISSWVKMGDQAKSFPTLISKGGGSATNEGYWVFFRNGVIWFYLSNGTSRLQTHSTGVTVFDNSWHHIGITIARDGNVTFYLDGVNKGIADISAFNGQDIRSSINLSLGSWQSSSFSFLKGSIDDTRIYNLELTPEEVFELSGCDPVVNYPPLIVEEAMADPATVIIPDKCNLSVIAEDANYDLLTYSWSKLAGPGEVTFIPNNDEFSDISSASFLTDGSYTIQVAVTDGLETVYSQVDVLVLPAETIQAVAYWPMDEGVGTYTEDKSINENNGILKNGTSWITGVSGSCLQFDGINDRVNCGTGVEMDMGSGDFSISTWVKLGTAQNSYPTLLSKGAGSTNDAGYWVFVKNGLIKFYLSNGVSRINAYSDPVEITADAWHHIAITIDRDGDITFYVDAVSTGTHDISAFNGQDISSSKSLTMASWQTSSFSYLNGSLDDTRLFNSSISSTMVAELYNLYAASKKKPIGYMNNELKVYPNPFNDQITIAFTLTDEQLVTISIYNILGELVQQIQNGSLPEGRYRMSWDSKTQYGTTAPMGIYFIKIIKGNEVDQKTIVRTK